MAARRGVLGIFGEDTVDVEMDSDTCMWIVKATDGRVLLHVPWLWAYDQRQLGKRVFSRKDFLTQDEYLAHTSRWEAFEVCMCAYPLTSEDKRLLDQRFPGITSQRQYRVHDPIWQPEPRGNSPLPAREPRIPVRPPPSVVSQTPPAEPAQVPETAHEAGERKLLL